MIDARYLFEKLFYAYSYIDNKSLNAEDTIVYENTYLNAKIQFNLVSKVVYYQFDNKFKEYDKIGLFITKELIQAINLQIEELGWFEDEK